MRKEYASKTQKLMNPINSMFLHASQLWEENYALPTMFQAECLNVSTYMFFAIQHMFGTYQALNGTLRNWAGLDWFGWSCFNSH